MNLQERNKITDLENKLILASGIDGVKGKLEILEWTCTHC